MANTYSQIFIQIVFAVKGRENLIHENNRDELEKFMTGIISNRGQKLLAIFCMPDQYTLLAAYFATARFLELFIFKILQILLD